MKQRRSGSKQNSESSDSLEKLPAQREKIIRENWEVVPKGNR